MKGTQIRQKLTVLLAAAVLAIVGTAAMSVLFADANAAYAIEPDATNYDLKATRAPANLSDPDAGVLPGVYKVQATMNTGDNPKTIGIPSVAKQNLTPERGATKELPAIIMGAAVNYELRTGPTEFTPISGAELLPPYSYFRWGVMDEQTKEPDGTTTTHKKLSGFNGSYYIIRIDVSQIIADARAKAEAAGGDLEGKYLHVRQQNNKALLVATGMTDYSFVWADAKKSGCKAAAYSLADGAKEMKDTSGGDQDTPYLDVILMSSSKNVAGADTGGSSAPVSNVDLSFYVDDTKDYKPWLKALDPNNMPNFPYTVKNDQDEDVTFQSETDYNTALTTKFFDESKDTAENSHTSYQVMGEDLEIDVAVGNNEEPSTDGQDSGSGTGADEQPSWGINWLAENRDFWSMEHAIPHEAYDNHTITLICEVPVLDALSISGINKRSVILDVNSFDIQIANNTEQGKASLLIGNNAQLRIKDGSNTAGAELAIGNNATMLIEKGGTMVIDETCTAEAEYDASSTVDPSTSPAANYLSGEITVQDGGKLINHGVVNIEGTEGKAIDPSQQDPVMRDKQTADMVVDYGGTIDNYGCLSLKGILYVLGTLNNYGKYNDILKTFDPDKNIIEYHRGIQVTWKDDVTQDGVEPGVLNVGIDADGNVNMNKRAVLNNYGDIVLVPGTFNVYGIFNNKAETDGYAGHLYQCRVTEAIIPVVDPNDPLVKEKRITLDKPRDSVFNARYGDVNNEGVFGEARVDLLHNGVLGKLTPITDITGAKVVLSSAAFTYNGKVRKPTIKTIGGKSLKSGTDYTAKWSNASSKNVGTYKITITGKGDYKGQTTATYKINKAANTLKIKAKTATVKLAKLKKKAQTLAVSKVITFTNKGQGTRTYTKASGNKKITINKKTGKVTVKKGLKKGTYKVKVKVKAAGNASYKASAVKTVTFSIKVK